MWSPEQLLQFPQLGPTQVRQLASHLRLDSTQNTKRERGGGGAKSVQPNHQCKCDKGRKHALEPATRMRPAISR